MASVSRSSLHLCIEDLSVSTPSYRFHDYAWFRASVQPPFPLPILRPLLLLAFKLGSNAKKVMLHAIYVTLIIVLNPTRVLALGIILRRPSCASRALLGCGAALLTRGALAEAPMHG
jgi:hypothetical protein